MSAAKDEMRTEYRREDLSKGVRGKYAEHMTRMFNPPHPGEVLRLVA